MKRDNTGSSSGQKYDLAYIEFDDMGEYWTIGNLDHPKRDPVSQLDAAVDLIAFRKKEKPEKPVAVIAFVHGWKNNASEYDERHKSLAGFKSELQHLATDDPTHSYIGVFLSWRGQSVSGDLFSTYWNRRGAARRVGGPSMTEALFRLMFATKPPVPPSLSNNCGAVGMGDPRSHDVFILIGHSFGVRVLERAISQPIMALIYERRAEADACRKMYKQRGALTFESPADLIVLINAANDAFEAKAMIEGMRRMNLRACSGDTCQSKGDYFDSAPIIVSILSDGDWITGKLMPLAQLISYPSQNLSRRYDREELAEKEGQIIGVKQHSFFLHNEGSIGQLISHKITTCGGTEAPCSACPEVILFPAMESSQPQTLQFQLAPANMDLTTCRQPEAKLQEQRAAGSSPANRSAHGFVNNTPFWVFRVPTAIIPNHTDIFKPGAVSLLGEILKHQISVGTKAVMAEEAPAD